jgi:hypothetical protein
MSNNYRPAPQQHGTNPNQRLAQVIDIKSDPEKGFRVKVRVWGDQSDQMLIPDENCQWVRCEVDPTNKGGTPYILPGMTVRVNDMGGSPGGQGIGPYITSVHYTPTNPETGNTQGPIVAHTNRTAQPRQQQGPYPYNYPSQNQDPKQANTTMQSQIEGVWIQQTSQTARDKALQKKNRFDQTTPKYSGTIA